MNPKTSKGNAKKTLCIVGIIIGVLFTIQGIKNGFYDPKLQLLSYRFGSDYNTESYNASYMIFQGVIATGVTIARFLSDLLAAIGLFDICFFGIKLMEITEQNEKSAAELKKPLKRNNDSNKKEKNNNKGSDKSDDKTKNDNKTKNQES